jgi:hypothetical protein
MTTVFYPTGAFAPPTLVTMSAITGVDRCGGFTLRRAVFAALAAFACLVAASPAAATPVATSQGEYDFLGRVFPDPMAGCQNAGNPPCDPNAQGDVPAAQFIGVDEFVDALRFMNSKPEWQRYMEVWALDGKLDGEPTANASGPVFEGNNRAPEFDPKPEYVSAGLPTTDLGRRKSDLMVVRVTDETVPDAGKKRYALSLSIHGIERAGAEGGIRAMEDLVTAATTGRSNSPIVPPEVKRGAPTMAQALRETIIYFTLPNPDGWRRGSVSSGGVFFQRYNGNGVDPNRDWPDVGFSFRPYSSVSEPETRAWIAFYDDIKRKTDSRFAAGDDLHGQPEADALSYTLLPHGRHQYGKDERIRETAKRINRGTFEAIKWSPIVQDNDQPRGGGPPCAPGALGDTCAKIYGQTWGSVYDTINYTTTGALGDWFDSSIGLNADGIDNEMSFSHLDKNIVFDPHTEQLHVAGNKALIYAHIVELIDPPNGRFTAAGRKGYVPLDRLRRADRPFQGGPPPGTRAQDDPPPAQGTPLQSEFPIDVQRSETIYNGGMRVDVTASNIGGIGTGTVGLEVQCQHCDDHPGVKDDEDWVTVAEDYNQSSIYAQSGVTAAVNRPQTAGTDGKKVNWRALVSGPAGTPVVNVDFTSGPATQDGSSGGDEAPVERGFDVANTDFMADMNRFITRSRERFARINPRRVIAGRQKLSGFDSIVLADQALPGYKGSFGDANAGPPPADMEIASDQPTVPGGYSPGTTGVEDRVPGSFETREFTVRPDQSAGGVTVRIEWPDEADDWDMYLYRRTAEGRLIKVGESTGVGGTTNFEQIDVGTRLKTGTYVLYVDNWSATPLQWTGSIKFRPLTVSQDTGPYTRAEKDTWFARLRDYVEGGGNLVLTDGALEGLPELTPRIPLSAVSPTTVYVGQMTFAKSADDVTTNDPLATKPMTLSQPGARFNTGMRRQMYEPTPLGFAIQNPGGADSSYAIQWDIDRSVFERAGGRVAATSADGGARNAAPVYDRVTLGELKIGSGQIRVAGALLPQPSEAFDHPQGLEPYAVTYSGYILFRNLLEVVPRGVAAAGNNRFRILSRRVRVRRNSKGNHIARVKVRCSSRRGCYGKLKLQVRKKKRPGRRDQSEDTNTNENPAKTAGNRRRTRTRLVVIGRKKFAFKKSRTAVLRIRLTLEGRRLSSRRKRVRIRAEAPVRFGKKARGGKGVARRPVVLLRAKGQRILPPSTRRRGRKSEAPESAPAPAPATPDAGE